MKREYFDWPLILPVILISLAGVATMSIFSLLDPYFIKQIAWVTLSLIACFVASRVDYRFLKQTRVVMSLYGFVLFLLTSLFVLGKVAKGAQSWFSFGGFAFQPVDITKLVVIILLAKYFSRRHIEIANIRHIIVSGLYALVPFILVLLQPDFGSAMVIASIWFGMVLVSGISKKHLMSVFGIALIIFVLAWGFLFKPYQKARIMNFVHPLADIRGSGYNAYQSTIAVGSGGLYGKGIGYGTQSRLEFLPEYRTDFIFAAYAEEWGFLGSILLFLLFFIVYSRLLRFAYVAASNFEAFFAYGVVIWFLIHTIVSIGMNIGVLPVTGIPLPFMSYGGSHLIVEYLALGMCIGMYRYSRSAHRDTSKNEFLGLE